MNLLKDVVLSGRKMGFEEYCCITNERHCNALELLMSADEWPVSENLTDKINSSGKMRPFYGDTVVVTLDKKQRLQYLDFQHQIEMTISTLLADSLDCKQFHVTIHDLSNGTDISKLEKSIQRNELKCRHILNGLFEHFREHPDYAKIKLNSNCFFPASNTAILSGLLPATDRDYRILMNVYNLFDQIKPLDYLPMFHMTLSYFKPKKFISTETEMIQNVMTTLADFDLSMELDLWRMEYQYFLDMNNYIPLLGIYSKT